MIFLNVMGILKWTNFFPHKSDKEVVGLYFCFYLEIIINQNIMKKIILYLYTIKNLAPSSQSNDYYYVLNIEIQL